MVLRVINSSRTYVVNSVPNFTSGGLFVGSADRRWRFQLSQTRPSIVVSSLPTDHTSPITQNGKQSATNYLSAPIFSNIYLGNPINMCYKLGSQINRGRPTDHGLSADRLWLWRSPSDPIKLWSVGNVGADVVGN